MSLINEALRKARQAAAEHEDQRPGGPFQAPRAYPSRGPRRGMGMAAVIAIAGFAAVSGAALVWWAAGSGNQPETTSIPPSDIRPLEPTPSPDPQTVAAAADQPPEIAATPTSNADQARPDQTVSPPSPAPTQNEARPSPTSVPTRAKETVVMNEQGERERVYVLDADLGNVTLSLGYIVARTTNPFAEINGVDVFVGSEVEGFVVEEIGSDRVVLRDADGLLVLKVP